MKKLYLINELRYQTEYFIWNISGLLEVRTTSGITKYLADDKPRCSAAYSSEDRKDKDSFHVLNAEIYTKPYSQEEPDFGHLPRFSERLPHLRDSLQSGFLDLLLLIFLNVTLFMASYLAFLKYDVR